MDELVAQTRDGDIEITLSWVTGTSQPTGAEATRGLLRVNLRGQPVWYGENEATGFEWTWIELLEFLAESWLYLAIEDGAPLGVALDTAPRMLAAAEAEIQSGYPLGSDLEDQQLEAYRMTHDLSEAVQGAVVPPLWIVRDGESGWVASAARTARAPFKELLDVLIEVGDFIASRLAPLSDNRSISAARTWNERESRNRLSIIEAATGYPPDLAAQVEAAFYSQDERDWGWPRSDELLAAARMVGPQSPTTLKPILDAVREVRKADTSTLDQFAEQAMKVIASKQDAERYAQGYQLAGWLRSELGVVGDHRKVNPDEVLTSWQVPVIDVAIGVGDIDAIGCWGPSHGPAVLVNSDARHAKNVGRRRATLAHEICHLLVDRCGSLPLVEVLGGRTAKHAEQRARAFAAEFLMPRELAGLIFSTFQGDDASAVQNLCSRFGVSSELLAWQVRNSGVTLTPTSRKHLASLVRNPLAFGVVNGGF
ncbi:MAG: ImmA/IrrE family metallo-endopeptidase [bacterium]|nr:ImmA/IrrE family metallo-endopeptidase [Acidimicrobiia bacterium]MCY4651276.1 ImmA/IrrE family metallo-endopeptidase [bacterium]